MALRSKSAFMGLWLIVWMVLGLGACRKGGQEGAGAAVDAGLPCRMKQALESFNRFHAQRIAPLGASGSGLFSGGADPMRLRSLAALMSKTAAALAVFHSGAKEFDGLVARRARMFRDMAAAWNKLAGDLESKDMAAFKRDRVALISLRARDVTLRKRIAALYDACGMASPF